MNTVAASFNITTGQMTEMSQCNKQSQAPSNVFLNGVHVQFSDKVKYLGVYIAKCLTKG